MAKKNIATFLGPQLGLVTLGDYCYAYSGGLNLNNETKTFLEFHTGKYTVLAGVQTTVRVGNLNLGKRISTKISLNGTPISDMGTKIGITTSFDISINDPMTIIIPPNTHVQVEVTTDDTEGDIPFYVTLTGRIYNA